MNEHAPVRVGFAMTGSFCTFSQVIDQMEQMAQQTGWQLYPILSPNAYETDTRFGSAQQFRRRIEEICGREIWHTLTQTEPIGPKKLLDVLLVAPCTGNTLGKMAAGITDTSATMAAKSHLRNGRPVVLGISTNDGLAVSLRNLGDLNCRKNIYLVPFRQDNPITKPNSLVADMNQIPAAVAAAAQGKQLQPVLLGARIPL